MQSQIRNGPYYILYSLYMLAIAFNIDQLRLQCRKSSQSHVTMTSGRISRKQIFDDCKHIWSLLKGLHPYQVLIFIMITYLFSHFRDHDCNASIFGPYYKNN